MEEVADAVNAVKQAPLAERMQVIRSYLDSQVIIGPPIPDLAVGKGGGRRPGWEKAGAQILHHRALFVSRLSAEQLWP